MIQRSRESDRPGVLQLRLEIWRTSEQQWFYLEDQLGKVIERLEDVTCSGISEQCSTKPLALESYILPDRCVNLRFDGKELLFDRL